MKQNIVAIVCLVGGLLLSSSMVSAKNFPRNISPGAGIRGTAHDLSALNSISMIEGEYKPTNIKSTYGGGDLNQTCIWCHTPSFTAPDSNMGAIPISYLPLWNSKVSLPTYVLYAHDAENAVLKDTAGRLTAKTLPAAIDSFTSRNQPGGVSRLCLSCHDGTIATNTYGRIYGIGYPASSIQAKGAAPAFLTDPEYMVGLPNRHPIGFDFDSVVNENIAIQSASAPFGSTEYTIKDFLPAGSMECTTCHDVHNTKNQGEHFLWISDYRSSLCFTCHLENRWAMISPYENTSLE